MRCRKIANELAREGLTPLQVMIDTMRELCQQAANAPTATERIEKKLAACAVTKDAAPYIQRVPPRAGVEGRPVSILGGTAA